jgi:uncharacterized protein (DUF2345 family)
MSISSLDLINQTTLVPNTLLGYSSNGVSAIEILPTSITIAGDLTTTPIYVGISASTGLTTTLATGLDVNCDFNMNSNDITNLDTLSSTTGNPLTISSDDILYLNSANNTQINAVSSFTAVAGDNIILTATNDAMTLSADDDITIGSVSKGILINGGTGDAGNNDIVLTTQNATLQGVIILQSGGDIQLNASNAGISALASADITLTSTAEDIGLNAYTDIFLTSADNTQVNCGENFLVQTNSTTGLINLNTGDLFNGGGIKWNSYPMGMTFLHKWQGSFSYPIGSPNTWDISQITTTSFPLPFLYGTWAVSFSINFHSQGSATSDKGFACYIDFTDGNGTPFTGFTFNQATPYAQYFNASNYVNTSQTPMIITMTDYFDFTGAVNNLDIRLNYYADNPINQNYSITSAFTLMTLLI